MFELIIFITLLICGLVFGKISESNHYKSIQKREQLLINLPTTTSKKPTKKSEILKSNLTCGSVVISIDYFKNIAAGLRNFFGGNVQSYESLVDRARREAVLRLKESCKDADEIINLRLETSSIYKNANRIGSVEVLAYATAIYYKKNGIWSKATKT